MHLLSFCEVLVKNFFCLLISSYIQSATRETEMLSRIAYKSCYRQTESHSAQCAFWVVRWPCGQKLKSKNTLSDGKKIFLSLFFLCWNIIFGTLKISQNDLEIPNLEFESHSFLENHAYLPTEQAETNICWIIYQNAYFKICLMFRWFGQCPKENVFFYWCLP